MAFYDLTGCQGCILSFLFNEDEVLDLAKHFDIKAFRFIKEQKDDKQLDIVFVEGLVASNDDLRILRELRERSKILVALGTCACTGCIPAYRNFMDASKYAHLVHDKTAELGDQPPTPINEHVAVEYYIPGCPPDKKQIASFMKDIALGKNPYDYDKSVCFECRLNENRCLLDEGKLCLGPITRGGCNSVCPNGKLECWGCRGLVPDANIPLMIKLLEKKGFTKDQIKQRMRTFAGMQIERPELKAVQPKRAKRAVKKKSKKKAKQAKKLKKAKKTKNAKRVKKAVRKKPEKQSKNKSVSKKPAMKRPETKPVSKSRKAAAKMKQTKKQKKPTNKRPGKPQSLIGMLKGKLKKK
ncbi:hypothetical protein JW898_05255 [Candidatus Woesearchaeota archaeon]|nr:hypothetical protein [Candidatus Woesearchaeota archaeon]